MHNHRIESRPRVQGASAPLRVRHSAQNLTDSGGLVLLRRLWDRLDLGQWLDRAHEDLPGRYRPSLMVEVWTALLFYGGGVLDDLWLLSSIGAYATFGDG
ncbi:MAG: hypothetical protein R6U63_08225 [Longimicrobiales bacterium]